jgi:hypothetical protein
MGAITRSAFVAAVLTGISACTVGNLREAPDAPSKYDTRKLRRELTMTTAIDATPYLNSLMRRAYGAGCSAGVVKEVAIIDCGADVHLELTPKEKTVEVACFARSIAICRKEIARIEAFPDPKAAP